MLSFSALVFSALAAASAPTPHSNTSNLVISPCEAGEHRQFEIVTCDIELKNIGNKPIHVSKGEAAMPWDSIDTGVVVVPPHGTSYIKARIAVRDSAGYTKRSFRFVTDEPGTLAQRGSHVEVYATTVLDERDPVIDFGTVNLGGSLPTKSVMLNSREVKNFRILGILSKPEFLDVAVAQDGRTVNVTLRENAPWGLVRRAKVKLKINVPQQAEAWISVNADVHGDIVPDGNPYSLGLMRTNNKNEFLVRLTSRSGKDFKIGSLELDGIKGKASVQPCTPAQEGCKLVRLDIDNDQGLGRLQGTLNVELPDFKRTLPIELVGMLLSPNFVVHDFNAEAEKARAAKEGGESSPVLEKPKSVDITQAIKQTVHKEAEAPLPGTGPLLRWSVANQGSIYGYIIYRADAESGPFVRVSKETIKVHADDGNLPGTYQWRDDSAVSGQTYWYSISTLKNDGSKQSLAGAQKVVAK